MEELCPICGGNGLRIIERPDGSRAAQDCVCRVERRVARRISAANIPTRFLNATLESFDCDSNDDARHTLSIARFTAKNFVKTYRLHNEGKGLLFTGPPGRGKTHLAVSILKSLLVERGATGIFYDYQELLKKIQNSYNPRVQATELEVLAPIFEAEILVLDDIGASKPTDWVSDTVNHILNTRYNDRRTTILTTNKPNLPPTAGDYADKEVPEKKATLGDRIGERMRSRLHEMCVIVDMTGAEDIRQTVKQARFA